MGEPLTISIRQAAPHELKWVKQTWSRSARVRLRDYEDGAGEMVPVGRGTDFLIGRAEWTWFHNRLVDDIVVRARVLCADVEGIDGMPCGWVCYERSRLDDDGRPVQAVIHHAFVVPENHAENVEGARRRRVGEQLVRHVVGEIGRDWRPSYMTAAGQPFFRHLAAAGLTARQHAPPRHRGQRSNAQYPPVP